MKKNVLIKGFGMYNHIVKRLDSENVNLKTVESQKVVQQLS